MPSTLSNQASELIDHICSFLDSPKDILSFALTSKKLYNVAIPDHIEFRHLRCDIRRISIWRKLTTLPAIALRFVSLEIIVEDGTDRRTGIIPTRSILLADRDTTDDILFDWSPRYFWVGEESEESDDELEEAVYKLDHEKRKSALKLCMQEFVAALQCMSGLTRFHWLVEHISPTEDVSAALLECPAINDVDIFSSRRWDPDAVINPAVFGPWQLSYLRRFSMDFKEEFDWDISQQYTSSMIKMLDRCPSLEDLHIFPYHPTYLDTTQLFERGRWPSLKRFTLRRMSGFGDGILNTFIKAHPQLERLYIDTDDFEAHNAKRVWSEGLPNLKALHVGVQWDMTQILSPITMRNLEFLSVVDISLKSGAIREHLRILAQIPNLRSVVVHFPEPSPELLGRFADAIPFIERLQFRFGTFDAPLRMLEVLDDQDGIFPARLAFISRLHCLTHLSSLICVDADSDTANGSALIDGVVHRVARASATLRYLQLFNLRFSMPSRSTWVTIERDEEGMYVGWHFTEDLRGICSEDWGGFFLGAHRHAALGF